MQSRRSRQRDQALQVNKDHFKIAVGLTEEKAERFTANILKINFSLISSVLTYLNLRRMLLKREIREALSDKLIVHNNRANDWMHRQNFDHAMKVIDPYRQR